jgi:hypothetical protein
VSFSSGLLTAIIKVNATNVLSAIAYFHFHQIIFRFVLKIQKQEMQQFAYFRQKMNDF